MDLEKFISKLDSNQILKFFKEQKILHLSEGDINILREIDITGFSFLSCTKEDLFRTKLRWGRVIEIFNLQK